MTDLYRPILGFLTGSVLGFGFFYALWATVRCAPEAGHAALLVMGSMAARFGAVLLVLWLLAQAWGWGAVLAAAVGFTAARALCVRRWGPARLAPVLSRVEGKLRSRR